MPWSGLTALQGGTRRTGYPRSLWVKGASCPIPGIIGQVTVPAFGPLWPRFAMRTSAWDRGGPGGVRRGGRGGRLCGALTPSLAPWGCRTPTAGVPVGPRSMRPWSALGPWWSALARPLGGRGRALATWPELEAGAPAWSPWGKNPRPKNRDGPSLGEATHLGKPRNVSPGRGVLDTCPVQLSILRLGWPTDG